MSLSSATKRVVEQRQSPRQRVQSPARIDVGDGRQMRDCMLWDVSEAGVRITIDAPAEVPAEFSLLLSNDDSDRRRCQIIWRSDQQIGARYLGAPAWSWTA